MVRTARRTRLPFAALAFVLLLGAAGSARAQRYYREREYDAEGPHWGPYFALCIGGGVQLIPAGDGSDDGAGALQGEVRLGYSFGRLFQLYLDADFSGSSPDGYKISASDVMVGLRYFFFANRFTGVYMRAGLGVGIVSGLAAYTANYYPNTQYGIAESYGLGMEFRLGDRQNLWSLSPEIFYRRTNETQEERVDTLGIGLLINFN